MSHYKHEAKQSRHEKLKSMGVDKPHKTAKHFDDTHPYDGVPLLTTDENSGLQPVGKQRFRRGGKVAHAEGKAAKHHLGHKPRVKKEIGGGLRSEHTQYEKSRQKAVNEASDYGMDSAHNEDTLRDATRKFEQTAKETGYAAGGLTGLNPMLRKKRVAALAMRKKKAGLPYAPPAIGGIGMPHKKGGAVHKHEDVAADKKLIKSMVKGEALKHREEKCWGGRTKKADGGGMRSESTQLARAQREAKDAYDDVYPSSPGKMVSNLLSPSKWEGQNSRMYQSGKDLADTKQQTGEYKKGGRAHRKAGGRTTINLIVDAGGKQARGQAPMPMAGAPAIPPQLAAALAGGAGGPPPGGPPPGAMPPGAGMAGAGGGLGAGPAMNVGKPGMTAPTPPMRKSGGRVGGKALQASMPAHQEHDYGSGSGLGRLEKRKWPLAK